MKHYEGTIVPKYPDEFSLNLSDNVVRMMVFIGVDVWKVLGDREDYGIGSKFVGCFLAIGYGEKS